MKEPTLADEFAQIMNGGAYARSGFLDRNRARILAALRIAEIVESPTDEQAHQIWAATIEAELLGPSDFAGCMACATIFDLAKNGASDA